MGEAYAWLGVVALPCQQLRKSLVFGHRLVREVACSRSGSGKLGLALACGGWPGVRGAWDAI